MSEEIKWEVGQEVWDVIFGKGVVVTVAEDNCTDFPVIVLFDIDYREESFTKGGIFFEDTERSLFFSEPEMMAAMFHSKKKFVPALKNGDDEERGYFAWW